MCCVLRFASLALGVFFRPFAHSPIRPFFFSLFPVPCSLSPSSLRDIDNNKKIVVLKWGRPQEYVDGSEMDDLGGFVVLRATEGERGQDSGFAQVATITVTDRDRFRKAKQFSYTDTQLTAGVLYRYRVQAVTLDGYASAASNTVELVWKDTPPATATPTPAPTKR